LHRKIVKNQVPLPHNAPWRIRPGAGISRPASNFFSGRCQVMPIFLDVRILPGTVAGKRLALQSAAGRPTESTVGWED